MRVDSFLKQNVRSEQQVTANMTAVMVDSSLQLRDSIPQQGFAQELGDPGTGQDPKHMGTGLVPQSTGTGWDPLHTGSDQGLQHTLQQLNLTAPKPELRFLYQPTPTFRFRYLKEPGLHGPLLATNSTPERRCYPTIELKNFRGKVEFRVRLYTWAEKCSQRQPHDILRFHVVEGHGRGRQQQQQSSMQERMSGLEEQLVIPFPEQDHPIYQLSGIRIYKLTKDNLQVLGKSWKAAEELHQKLQRMEVCLHVEAVQEGRSVGEVFSNKITNHRDSGTLRICRRSLLTSYASGDQELWLITSNVTKDDIEVKISNGKGWSSFCTHLEVYHKHTIICRTPRYEIQDLSDPVSVNLCLYRPSDQEHSKPHDMQYLPNQKSVKKRKHHSSAEIRENRCSYFSSPSPTLQHQPGSPINLFRSLQSSSGQPRDSRTPVIPHSSSFTSQQQEQLDASITRMASHNHTFQSLLPTLQEAHTSTTGQTPCDQTFHSPPTTNVQEAHSTMPKAPFNHALHSLSPNQQEAFFTTPRTQYIHTKTSQSPNRQEAFSSTSQAQCNFASHFQVQTIQEAHSTSETQHNHTFHSIPPTRQEAHSTTSLAPDNHTSHSIPPTSQPYHQPHTTSATLVPHKQTAMISARDLGGLPSLLMGPSSLLPLQCTHPEANHHTLNHLLPQQEENAMGSTLPELNLDVENFPMTDCSFDFDSVTAPVKKDLSEDPSLKRNSNWVDEQCTTTDDHGRYETQGFDHMLKNNNVATEEDINDNVVIAMGFGQKETYGIEENTLNVKDKSRMVNDKSESGISKQVYDSITTDDSDAYILEAETDDDSDDYSLEAGTDDDSDEYAPVADSAAAAAAAAVAGAVDDVEGLKVNDFNDNGYTALHQAVAEGEEEVVKALLAEGAEVNLQTKLSGDTALHLATKYNKSHLLPLLLNQVEIDLFVLNDAGHTFFDLVQRNTQAFEVICNHQKIKDLGIHPVEWSSDSEDEEMQSGVYWWH
ncbi:uncharacterized protein [Panulirus ornatus]